MNKINIEKILYDKLPETYEIHRELENNFDKKYNINKIFKTNNYGNIKVLGVHDKHNNYKRYVCEFIDTGFKILSKISHVKDGNVRDYLYPTLCNIAAIGYVKNPQNHPYYKFWDGIIRRCTGNVSGDTSIIYKNVTINDRWKRFDYFLDDLINLTGFKECVTNNISWAIDKDILFYGNKIYSKDTCCIIPTKINSFFTNNQRRRNKTGYIGIYQHKNSSIWRVSVAINGKNKSFGGYNSKQEAYEAYHKAKKEVLELYLEEYYWLTERIKIACREFFDKQHEEIIKRNINKSVEYIIFPF